MRDRLTDGEYWEWRTTIAEMNLAKLNLEKVALEMKLLDRDLEIQSLKRSIFSLTKFKDAMGRRDDCESEYEKFKAGLEESVGQSLNGKVISDITFEISESPQSND